MLATIITVSGVALLLLTHGVLAKMAHVSSAPQQPHVRATMTAQNLTLLHNAVTASASILIYPAATITALHHEAANKEALTKRGFSFPMCR
tara:strand:- start:172 stop:444 length:273 start_codon:yes stop_codon:yes gene_type:complete